MASAEHQDEIKHRYEFVRHLYQMFITWFTVFSGLNLTVFGWIVGSILQKKEAPLASLVLLFAGMMIVQNALALVACWYVSKEFRRTSKRLSKLANTENIAMPMSMYSTTAVLVALGCGTYLVAWVVLPYASNIL